MKYRLLLIGLFCLTLSLGISVVSAQTDGDCKVITLLNGWAPATTPGAPNGVIYGYVANLSSQPDTLLSATTDAAEAAELHQTSMGTGDMMQMQPVEGGLMIAARDYQELKSGGFHIMLVNLKQPLTVGQSLNLTLKFQNVGEVKVVVPVVDAQSNNPMDDMTMEPAASSDMGSMSMSPTAMPSPMAEWPEGCAKLHVLGAWARPAGPGVPNDAAYGLLVNATAADDTLVSATTSVAATVEVHEMVMSSGDVMQMRPIEGGLVIPAGEAVVLQPGGKHIMMFGLTQQLPSGSMLDLTLNFVHAGELKLMIPVHDPSAAPMSMEMTPETSGG